MSFRSIFAVVVGLAVLGLVVAISLGSAGRSPGERDAMGDALVLSYNNDPDTLNLITANDSVSEAFHRHVYETLADRDFGDPDNWVPKLAESWEFDEETLTYTIHLRPGVKWHPMELPNGEMLPETEFTALDVKFTFDVILNPHVEAAALRSYYENPDAKDESNRYKIRVSIVDKYTVQVQWTEPYFLSKEFTLGIPVIPRHVYSVDENGEPIALNFSLKEFADGFNTHWANTKMCGTGPMMFQSWTRNVRLVLVRNPNYWGDEFPFKRIVYHSIPNANTVTQKLLQGDLDLAAMPDKDQYIQQQSHENVIPGKMVTVNDGKEQWVEFEATEPPGDRFVKMVEYPYPGYRYIGYNLNRPIFKDPQFRWALAHAIPVQRIIDQIFKGLADRTTGPFMAGSSAYNEALPPIEYDLPRARKILADAGWKDLNGDAVLDKKIGDVVVPARFDLMIFADSATYRTVAEIVKENGRKIGVDVTVSPTKWALMLEKLNNREYDATMLGWAMSWRQDPFQLWHSSQADVPYSSNHISYRNRRVDELIEQLRVTIDEEEQVPLYHEIHRLIYEDQPYTFLFSEKATAGYNARLENVKFYRLRPNTDVSEWQPRGALGQ